ncbi:DUF134 domain-containing protein [Methanonatronarchaeum sp. AMET-Sl]|uniref:DUF134 domain-containing protein n=1 Tax=Methanonatronarchaeum sp. AMET-Sl TaxID=3037654 RepID=UPI00244D9C24|nr:DUF134 domain-containing protein [Methanonatronarchaeum sp. AMET-Sl]WGI16665.1 DUF134 domain-containing protein [Methanonatronarchaeum sp. AMET-Sl]
MEENEENQGSRRRRGRPRRPRKVDWTPKVNVFKPRGVPARELQEVIVSVEEMEAIRLIDIENLTQEEAAEKMGVSRRSFWNDLNSGRQKITKALIEGNAVVIKGGNYSTNE